MVSTCRHHGFESHAEQQLLLALDFAGDLEDVLSQPFRLAFTADDGPGEHTPDFLAVTRGGAWLVDVRPGERIKAEDRIRFAAAAEVALSCGWRYAVVAGWRPHVQAALDTISAQRRPLADPLGLQRALLTATGRGPVRFGELVEQAVVPPMARAQALHLIWNRRLGVDLAAPLGDRSLGEEDPPAGPGRRAGHHAAAGPGPRDGIQRAGRGAPQPRAGLLHALAGRVPDHAGLGEVGGRGLVEVQRVIGANIVPSRVMRPTDKQACERAFGAIQSLLFEQLPGFRGVDVADRGADPEGDAVLTLAEIENLVATWIVSVWQNRKFGEYSPCWDPVGDHSPNTLFAAAMAQGGFSLEIPRPELYYELLPAHHVKIHTRGVKIRGLWYDGPALEGLRGMVSTRGGAHKRSWVIRSDRRDARTVFFQDDEHRWHELRWTGLPAEGEVPSFNDARVSDLLREARAQGLRPKSDTELLPLLLKLLGAHVPVSRWPGQMTRQEKKSQAREAAQSDAAAADRPAPPSAQAADKDPGPAAVVPLRRPDRAVQARAAVDEQRRKRREAAVPVRPQPPGTLGDGLRRTSLLSIPEDDEQ
jgi:hypothetical protein